MLNKKTNETRNRQALVSILLVLLLVFVMIVAVLLLLGPAIGNVFSNINVNDPLLPGMIP